MITPSNHPPSLWRRFTVELDRIILNLGPSYYSLTMGTGIVSILLYGLPWNGLWLRYIAEVIFVFNVLLFVLITLGSVVRYVKYKGLFGAVLKHHTSGMFWGCMPMGLVTIINMIAKVCVPAWGWRAAQLALGLWWIDVIFSILINFGMLFYIFARHTHTIETVSAPWLLPIVTSVVVAASGGVVGTALLPFSPSLARSVVLISYVVWGTGVPVALMLIVLWIYRTALIGLPAPAALPSVFLPLGPCGQGAFGIALLGKTVRQLSYDYSTPFALLETPESSLRLADAVYAGGLVTALILWGLGLVWYTIAHAIFVDHFFRCNRDFFGKTSFTIGFTAITFPIGVWATATTELAQELDSMAFKVIGTVVSLQVTFNWVYVMVFTIWKAWEGTIWVDPALSGFEKGRPPLRFGGKL
ncbi:hypothetical protein TREMEDRAFT_26125 [Tremella mesenterica DSM 1558]|nr:uncharacterized protein TREMEDRAFT_26125 [Tremella mesenterica DSM 1558]EIW72514.1 hypothetical protein TREMEDRAFT_26125 [Tremella mesenterica DSM 1558]